MMLTKAQQYAMLRDEQFSLIESYARQHGMTSKSFLVLMWIYNRPMGMTQESLAKRTFSTKQVIQAIVKTYRQKGWLRLELSLVDKRKKLVMLTADGQREFQAIVAPFYDYEKQAMSALSQQQQETLLEATRLFSQKFKSLIESHQVH
ncbi:MarR family winged helix-turn-helix transcriptional regulator [Streptococcus dentasini]